MEKKAFHRTVAVVLVLALLAVAAMLLIPRDDLGNSSGTAMAYEALFDPDTVMTVDIQVEESAWETMLENATAETYIQCDIVVIQRVVEAAENIVIDVALRVAGAELIERIHGFIVNQQRHVVFRAQPR